MTLAFDGGAPTTEEINTFIEYLLMFYGKGEIYENGMTEETAREYTQKYLQGNFQCCEENRVENEFGIKVPTHLWGGGDTIDREKVCELFLNAKEVA